MQRHSEQDSDCPEGGEGGLSDAEYVHNQEKHLRQHMDVSV